MNATAEAYLRCVLGNNLTAEQACNDPDNLSSRSRQRRFYKNGIDFHDCACDNDGFECRGCGQYSCRKCIVDFHKLMECRFSGHMDALNLDITYCASKRFLGDPSLVPEICHSCVFGNRKNVKVMRQLEIEFQKSPMKYDGYLFMPDAGIAIESPDGHKGIVDVHGLGADDDSGLPAVYHHCISAECAVGLADVDIEPLPKFGGTIADVSRSNPIKIKLEKPASPDGTFFTMKTEWIVDFVSVRAAKRTRPPRELGRNSLHPEEASRYIRFSNDDVACGVCDATVVYIMWSEQIRDTSLAVCRFWNGLRSIPTKCQVQDVYSAIEKRLEKAGYCRDRTGGSSGIFKHPTPELLETIARDRHLCQKQGRGQWWVPYGRHMNLFYKNRHGRMIHHAYSVFQRGGRFQCEPSLMEQFPFLFDFAATKVLAAMLCRKFSSLSSVNPERRSICEGACEEEIRLFYNCLQIGRVATERANTGLHDSNGKSRAT